MHAKSRLGFTLIELMIVVAVIAVIAAIAIPNLLAARLRANETSAVSTLRSICSAQAQFQSSARADVDGDGTGEFGLFRELAGASGVRTSANAGTTGVVLNPALLSGTFRMVDVQGDVSRSGYKFHLYLPDSTGFGIPESELGTPLAADVFADLAETTWCVYASPSSFSNSGTRTFFMHQSGEVTGTESSTYTGGGIWDASRCGSAFRSGGAATSITGFQAIGTVGRDGNFWRGAN